ncbi:GNAT family N-acetyltransferase [Paenibacillus selenitireducens]|uniref:GNAT family N-acetyltransferase n=1 Tax=Paenibacillus selenitireducens TaxID=1324314 RepID=A0A1T2X1R0_9BACL|nr:GNAT family N-acetyltransferase [Paenibacillus selenitireducens]OPA73821.1 GNAT family N-acetyltransferase [Paenibacillus selenitireducens]
MSVEPITTERLFLIPFTRKIATAILDGDFEELLNMGFCLGEGWPDEDAIETIPKILRNLDLVKEPTGFESWMIIKKDRMTIIGDTGFKGVPNSKGEIDIGYGLIEQERKKGYGIEAAQSLTDWAFSKPEVTAITAKSLINNNDSARILEKMKFKELLRDDEMIYWHLRKKI